VKTEILIDRGDFSKSESWNKIKSDIIQSIQALEYPKGAGKFILRNESGKKRGRGSGVKPIRDMFCAKLEQLGWRLEYRINIAAREKPGPIDAVTQVGDKLFAVEWETGNISSSHRALNKMALGLINGILIGGALILPTRKMYNYLTDRVGNFEELEPYFPMWRKLECREGLLIIFAVEQDSVDANVPRIPKGTNGRALL
jgi:hypothetical protein